MGKTKTYNYCVADFLFKVCIPSQLDIDKLLPSFTSFKYEGDNEDETLFEFTASTADLPTMKEDIVVDEVIDNDLGYIKLKGTTNDYWVEISFIEKGIVHYMHTDKQFKQATASINWNDPYADEVLSSLLRLVYSFAVLYKNAISIHASVVTCRNKAYLFMGKSGTGKSTHSGLWLQHIPHTSLLNDDNPTVRLINGETIIYGTPWSGKTPCYKNEFYEAGAFVRLKQAKENIFITQEGIDAFIALLPGCSAILQDKELQNELCETLISITDKTKVGILNCLPNKGAAILCFKNVIDNAQ